MTFVTDSGQVPVIVEIARDSDTRARGLMHRKKLEPLHGMIFIFDETEEHPFWMKNTMIPLDMFFVGENLEIIGIVERAEPLTESMRTVHAPSRYVVEVIGGFAQKHGIKVGARILLTDIL
ncbi:MAG: hypothetical protein A2341_22500 [Deltaproteobacteria bacterium RIFOXYB12_FULL_58_9]|nr:MAG: hypothetical protein A2341_22500 [Deltaproteobacteria bacterium RIFOXYB12_FULL_58_9]